MPSIELLTRALARRLANNLLFAQLKYWTIGKCIRYESEDSPENRSNFQMAIPGLFFVYICVFKQTFQFYNKKCEKNSI